MMTTMSDLSLDLVWNILSRISMTSLKAVRCTCKTWNALSKDWIFCKADERNQFMGFMMMNSKVCSMKFDLKRIQNNGDDLVDPSIKKIAKLDQIQVSKIFQCDGLLLCVIKDDSRLVVWNPYLGQTRWIQPRKNFHRFDRYALGYDKNRNHKILRISDDYLEGKHLYEFEIYDFSSDSWRVLDITPDWDILDHQNGVSLKGNTYFFGEERNSYSREIEDFLLCFDFTTEKFGPRLPLPFNSCVFDTVTLSCVRDDQLAVLYQPYKILRIWISTKVGPNIVSWSNFLSVDMRPITGFIFHVKSGSFFIDKEKTVAVVFNLDVHRYEETETRRYQTAYIIGNNGYFESVKLGVREAPLDLEKDDELYYGYKYCLPLVCSSYAPSLVQL